MTGADRREVADQPALVTHCTGCDERVGLERHIKSIGDRFYAVCYDCEPLDSTEEPQQRKLVTDGGSDRQLVICKNCGDEHYLDERKHRAASSFCPECRMRGGYVLDEYREEHKDKIRTDGGEEA